MSNAIDQLYKQLAPTEVDRQKTITVKVVDKFGDAVDLTGKTLTCSAQLDSASPIAPSFTALTQSGKTKGMAQAVITESQNDTAGTWKVRLFVGESSSTEEFLWEAAFTFESVAAFS